MKLGKIEEPYPFKMYRLEEGKLKLIDSSKSPERLMRNLEFLKETKPENHYIVVKTSLEIIDQTEASSKS